MAKEKEEGGPEEKLCIDEIPQEIKKIIIGAIHLCGRVGNWIDHVMRNDVSDKEACMDAWRVNQSAYNLFLILHRAFTWEDISKMMDDLGVSDDSLNMAENSFVKPHGPVFRIDSGALGGLDKEKKANEENENG